MVRDADVYSLRCVWMVFMGLVPWRKKNIAGSFNRLLYKR